MLKEMHLKRDYIVSAFILFGLAISEYAFGSAIANRNVSVHLLVEMTTIVVAAMAAIMAWHNLNRIESSFAKIILFGFVTVSGLDLLHTFSYQGMPPLFGEANAQLAAFYNYCIRIVELGIGAFVIAGRPLPGERQHWLLLGVFTVAVIAYGATHFGSAIPSFYVQGEGNTGVAYLFDGLIAALSALVAWLLWNGSRASRRNRTLAVAYVFLGIGQLTLVGAHSPGDQFSILGHICKGIAYYFIYRSVFIYSLEEPYARLTQSRKETSKQRAQLTALLNNIPAGVMQLDTDLRCRFANQSIRDAIAAGRAEANGALYTELLPPDWSALLTPAILAAGQGEGGELSFSIKGSDGELRHKRVIVVPERASDASVVGILVLVFDRTAQERVHQQLVASLNEVNDLKAALDAHAMVTMADGRGVITKVNSKFCAILKFDEDELIGRTHSVINSGTHSREFFKHLWRTIASGQIWSGEICNRAKDGALYWMYTTIVPFIGANGKPCQYIAIRADITQRKLAEQAAEKMAFYDVLTELPNRRLMMDRLQMVKASCARTRHHGALMMIDLDNFKNVNDTIGHHAGDELLKNVAAALQECMRNEDTVARLGGDEFAVILRDLSTDAAAASCEAFGVAEKIRDRLNTSHHIAGLAFNASASIGFVIFRDEAGDQSELLKQADMALYRAKAHGKNRIDIFDPSLQSEILHRSSLLADLREAVPNGELRLYYQPVVDQQRKILGYEALIRWMHPGRGMVAPVDFIPMAEQSGLILEIGQWVIEEACRQLRLWSKSAESAGWTISVNVSARQFNDSNFNHKVLQAIEQSGANPRLLKLELTESMFHADVNKAIANMQALQREGIRFSMDDFGTGYSCLSYLKQLPLDQLKIDRSFIRNVVSDANDASIAKTILALADSLGLTVVAEGIETEDQFDFLARHRCDAFQGYLFGRPEPLPPPHSV